MKEYKVITALFLSAVMLGTAPLTVWGAESFSTGESFSDGTENIPDIVTDSALSGESSERDYELSIETGTDVELTESDFYDPEFRVEKYVKVRNSGKKETRERNILPLLVSQEEKRCAGCASSGCHAVQATTGDELVLRLLF